MQDWPWVFDYGDVIYIYVFIFKRISKGYICTCKKCEKNIKKYFIVSIQENRIICYYTYYVIMYLT